MRTTIKSRISRKFDQIGQRTAEKAALERLEQVTHARQLPARLKRKGSIESEKKLRQSLFLNAEGQLIP